MSRRCPVLRTIVQEGYVDLPVESVADIVVHLDRHAAELELTESRVARLKVAYAPELELNGAPKGLRPTVSGRLVAFNEYRDYVADWLATRPPRPNETLLGFAAWQQQKQVAQLIAACEKNPLPYAELVLREKCAEGDRVIKQGTAAALLWLAEDPHRFAAAMQLLERERS